MSLNLLEIHEERSCKMLVDAVGTNAIILNAH